MAPLVRALVVVLALGLVFGMGVHYDSQYTQQWPYPSTDAIEAADDEHVGQTVFVFGTVEQVDETANSAQILVGSSDGTFGLTVVGFDAAVRPGGVVQVVGRLEPDATIDARAVRVVNPAGSSTLYKYGVSLVGAALVTVLVLRHWRIDVRTLSFEVRRDG